VPIVDDFQKIASLLGGERCQSPIVEDEYLHTCQALEHAGIAPVTTCEAERFQHTRYALIENRAVIAAGSMAESTGDPGLADAGGAGDQQILLAFDPFSLRHPLEQGPIEPAGAR
jgi:hypothetical protein